MLINNAYFVLAGSVILLIGLYFAFRVIGILRTFGLARPWTVLSTLIGFLFLGYIFKAL